MGNYEKAEGILDKYSKGKLSAIETQKELKKFGYGANLRGKSNIIPVYPLDGGDGFDVELAKGGAMLNKQMELFEDGGLMDEGGMVDEVSGNEVPPGSTREEVRDDIPAQLSEGEFVFPADVVRYFGLETLMKMRQEAKAGLQMMEDMGQMGNSEEATIPDDIPFDVNDLDMEDDGVLEYQVGGYVPPQNVAFQQSQFANYQPQITQPVTQPSTVPTYQAPTQQFTPTQAAPAPTFATFAQPNSVTYYHADGRTIQVPVDSSGNPLIPVPAGFSATAPTAAASTAPTTTPTYEAPQQPTGGEGPSPEELKRQEEYKQVVNERTQAAEELGYTKKQNVIEAILPFVVPGGSMLMPKPERGTILVDGTIADGSGGSFDPVSGEKVGGAGGILGNIATALGLGKKEDISEAASQMGVSPASLEGLKTIKGEESIKDLIESLPKESKAPSPKETKATAMDAAEFADTGVETALVTKEGKATDVVTETQEQLDARIAEAIGPVNKKTKKSKYELVSATPGGNVVVRGTFLAKNPQAGQENAINSNAYIAKEGTKTIDKDGNITYEYNDGSVERVPAKDRRETAMEVGKEAAAERQQAAKAAEAYGISATNADGTRKSASQLRSEMQTEQKSRADAARARAEQAREEGGGPDEFGGLGYSSGTEFGGTGYETSTGEAMVAKGGLMNKSKLAKQMKQSGLASKK